MSSALDTQVGGAHYKSFRIQPVEFCHKHRLDFIQGAFVKYVSRHKGKHGLEDLKKCIHFMALLQELRRKHPRRWWKFWDRPKTITLAQAREFTDQIGFQEACAVHELLVYNDPDAAARRVHVLINTQYSRT